MSELRSVIRLYYRGEAERIPHLGYFFLARMDDLFTEGMCFDTSTEGERGTLGWRPPLSTKVGAGGPCSIGLGQSEGPEESRLRKLRPYERSRCAEHGECSCRVCPPHRG